MNPIERQSKVSRELYDINLDTMQQLLGLAGDGIERYFTINADYVTKLAERPGPMQFLELQRHYGEALVAGLQYDAERGGRILGEAVQKSSRALMGAWSGAAEDTGALTEKAESVAEEAVETAANAADVVTRAVEQPDRQLEGNPLAESTAQVDSTPEAESTPQADWSPQGEQIPQAEGNPELEGSLEKVHGIGRAMARQLREAGVETLAQLAAIDVEELAREDHPLHPFRARIEADHWIDQARSLMDPQRH